MEQLLKVYLLLLSKIHKKLLFRGFFQWKFSPPNKKIKKTKPISESFDKEIPHANCIYKTERGNSMTDAWIIKLIQEEQEEITVGKNIFEQLRFSLQNKASKIEIKPTKKSEKFKTSRIVDKKKKLDSSGVIHKRNKKEINKSTADILHDLAVVSSSSALRFKKEGNLSKFMTQKK